MYDTLQEAVAGGVRAGVSEGNSSRAVKRKLSDTVTLEDLLQGWTRCRYLLTQKQRLCRMEVLPGSNFCGNHQPLLNTSDQTSALHTTASVTNDDAQPASKRAAKRSDRGARIPCPLDPSHNIFQNQLEMHLKICNETKKASAYTSWPYYCHNCNGGGSSEIQHPSDFSVSMDVASAVGGEKREVDVLPTNVTKAADATVDMSALLAKVERIYSSISAFIPTSVEDVDHQLLHDPRIDAQHLSVVDSRIRTALGGAQSAFHQTKHVEQDVALVHHMLSAGLLEVQVTLDAAEKEEDDESNEEDEPKHSTPKARQATSVANKRLATPAPASAPIEHTSIAKTRPAAVYLEFGAGKGLLGYAVHLANEGAHIGLIERSSNRKKIDRYLNERGASWARYRMDIRHVYLPELPLVKQFLSSTAQAPSATEGEEGKEAAVHVTLVAKHLCGVASDLAIRALGHLDRSCQKGEVRSGIALATCCHHACVFDDYVGRDWITAPEQGISRAEFDVLRYWTGWNSLVEARQSHAANKLAGQTTTNLDAVMGEDARQEERHSEEEEKGRNSDSNPSTEDRPTHQAPSASALLACRAYFPHMSLVSLQDVGRKVKRILDYGRVHYLRTNHHWTSVQLRQYCSPELSPECILLVGSSSA